MSKYIDAEKIPWTDLNDGRGGVNVYVTFLEKVARMPATDVVEVVRCGECIHWNAETKGCKRNPSVYRWYAKDFCSNGVR